MYYHIIDEDLNETIATYTDPVKAAGRAMAEALAGRHVRYDAPATCSVGGRWYFPGQLISIEEK